MNISDDAISSVDIAAELVDLHVATNALKCNGGRGGGSKIGKFMKQKKNPNQLYWLTTPTRVDNNKTKKLEINETKNPNQLCGVKSPRKTMILVFSHFIGRTQAPPPDLQC